MFYMGKLNVIYIFAGLIYAFNITPKIILLIFSFFFFFWAGQTESNIQMKK